jgi:anti-sigma B factor antagonist
VIPVAALRTSALTGTDGPVVVLSGEADATTAAQLREMLATQLDTGARRVTVDASGLSFLDSANMRVLVLAARALQGRHGTLVLARPQPLVARLLEITGADRLLDVRELACVYRSRHTQPVSSFRCISATGCGGLVHTTVPGEPLSGGYSSPQNGHSRSSRVRGASRPRSCGPRGIVFLVSGLVGEATARLQCGQYLYQREGPANRRLGDLTDLLMPGRGMCTRARKASRNVRMISA